MKNNDDWDWKNKKKQEAYEGYAVGEISELEFHLRLILIDKVHPTHNV